MERSGGGWFSRPSLISKPGVSMHFCLSPGLVFYPSLYTSYNVFSPVPSEQRCLLTFLPQEALLFSCGTDVKKYLGEALCCSHSGSCFTLPGLFHEGNFFRTPANLFWECLMRSTGKSLQVGKTPYSCGFQTPHTLSPGYRQSPLICE